MPAYSITEYEMLPAPDTVWVWNGLIPTSGSALLFGNPKLGKSFLALGLCTAVADPEIDSYLGQEIQQHGKVLYIQLDTPRNLWKKGYLKTVKSQRARDNIFILDKELPDRPNPFDIRTKEAQQFIRAEIDRLQPVLVIVDTMRRMHRADENDPTTGQLIFDILQDCTVPAALLLITHKKKQQFGDNTAGQARGSTAFTGSVDAIMNMTKAALIVEARSDIDDEIPIYQQKDGTWKLNSKAEDVAACMDELKSAGIVKPGDINKALMGKYNISLATAKRWREEFTQKQE